MVRITLLLVIVFIFGCGEDIENITQEMLDYSDAERIDILCSERNEFLLDRFVEPVEVKEVGAIMTIEGYLGKRVPKYPSYLIFISRCGTNFIDLINVHYQGPDIVVRVKGKLIEARIGWAGDMEVSSMEKVIETKKLIKAVDEHWATFAWKLMEKYDLPDKDLSFLYDFFS
ncbi:hypothetical protein FJZ31_26040 [Candidatus Poribacteria bacterium]|nr:hypothetical protein [Candidatus Poribacteria bacterium]